ncbi:hypothetical protein C2845_PM09G14710 [Panicum miliaceum]|uniref:Uncharacterized protein n=1 Tax=Panicum miliaceum TaxID=4540 RepID=A0A3L6RZ76_PANMI|nr:hypothetical protein C2845_PM09G14710 [Panicum miliaceum]
MGNCLNAASKQSRGGLLPEEEESLSEMRRISQLLRDEEEEEADAEYYPEDAEEEEAPPAAAEGLKVKVVLTRAELEWLMAQLKSGDRRLQDVLHHMHAAKAAAADKHPGGGAWRPRLESILECQETLVS